MRTRCSWRRRLLSALMACALSVGVGGAVLAVGAPASAVGSYDNAAIADKALTYVGKWGGDACNDAQKPGDSGGQCRAFVNCIVWMVSNHTQNLGGSDYYQPFLNAGGVRITDETKLVKGDIVQVGQGTHTFIIVGPVSGNTWDVVDSNHDPNNNPEMVAHYSRTFTLDDTTRAYRMGTVQGTATPPPPSDADNDGVPDSSDLCPSVPGRGFPDGCPRLLGKLTGDFNGDGKADAAAIYRYDGNQIAIFTFAGNGNGTFANPVWGTTQSGWDGSRTTTAGVGDFNADGKQDIAVFYRYPNNQIELFVFPGNGNGTFGNPIWPTTSLRAGTARGC